MCLSAGGADGAYTHEDGLRLKDLQSDLTHLREKFKVGRVFRHQLHAHTHTKIIVKPHAFYWHWHADNFWVDLW